MLLLIRKTIDGEHGAMLVVVGGTLAVEVEARRFVVETLFSLLLLLLLLLLLPRLGQLPQEGSVACAKPFLFFSSC